MTTNCELKSFCTLEVKNAAKGEVEAIIATFGVVDKDEDIIRPNAIAEGAQVSMSSYGHDVVSGNMPVGKGTLHREGNQAVFKGRMFLTTTRGRDTFEVLKEMGDAQQWSFGFRILGSEAPSEAERKAGARRVLTKLDAFEVSPVVIGAGVGTGTRSTKHAATRDPFAAHSARVSAIVEQHQPRPVTHKDFRRLQRELEPSLARWVLDTAEVSDAQQKAARAWADRGCAFMGESRVSIVWHVDDPNDAGMFKLSDPHAIYLNPTLRVDALGRTVLHELAHRKRFLRGLPNDEHLVERDEAELCELLGAA